MAYVTSFNLVCIGGWSPSGTHATYLRVGACENPGGNTFGKYVKMVHREHLLLKFHLLIITSDTQFTL